MSNLYPPPHVPNRGGYGPPPVRQGADGGFFGALFDFSFSTFATPYIVKLLYVLAMIALVPAWVLMTVRGFSESALHGLVVVLVGALVFLVYLAIIRLILEFFLAVVRMSEDIHHRLPRA